MGLPNPRQRLRQLRPRQQQRLQLCRHRGDDGFQLFHRIVKARKLLQQHLAVFLIHAQPGNVLCNWQEGVASGPCIENTIFINRTRTLPVFTLDPPQRANLRAVFIHITLGGRHGIIGQIPGHAGYPLRLFRDDMPAKVVLDSRIIPGNPRTGHIHHLLHRLLRQAVLPLLGQATSGNLIDIGVQQFHRLIKHIGLCRYPYLHRLAPLILYSFFYTINPMI